jgi:DNA repair photolyase
MEYDFPVSLQTKSSLISRDRDLISGFSDAEVMVSIGTLDEKERKVLEPHASPILDRLRALRSFSEVGVKTSVFFGPIYPTISIENIPMILQVFREYGAQEVMIDRFNLKPGILQEVTKKILHHSSFPDSCVQRLTDPEYYIQLQQQIHKSGKQHKLKILDAF